MLIPLGVFLFTLGLLLLTGSGRLRVVDEYMIWFQSETFSEEKHLAVPQAEALGIWYGKRALNGKPQAPYGPLQAVVTSPLVPLGNGLADLSDPDPQHRNKVRPFVAAHLTSVALAATAALLTALALSLGAGRKGAILLGVTLALGTGLVSYAGSFFPNPWCLCSCWWHLLRCSRRPI